MTNSPSGARVLTSDNIYAMLYVGPANTANASALSTNGVGGGAFLVGGVGAGYFSGGSRTIEGFAGGTTVTVQVRAWRLSAGATYEATGGNGVLNLPGEGHSNLIQVTLASGLSTPPNLTGLTGFSVAPVVVPEPSSIALGLLGLGALTLIRRRK